VDTDAPEQLCHQHEDQQTGQTLHDANTDLIAQGVTDMSKYNIINMSFWDTYMSLGGSGRWTAMH